MSDEPLPINRVSDDPRSGSVRSRYDWSTASPAAAIIQTVAVAADREPETLDPLYAVVDPDALDAVFDPGSDGPPDQDVNVSLRYAGYHVTVRSDGVVLAEPLDLHREGA